MDFVYEPTSYYITEDDWKIEKIKDDFLERLLNKMSFLELHKDLNLLWTDELEELLWLFPAHSPWKSNRDCRNTLVPVLYNKFAKIKKIIKITNSYETCVLEPDIICDEKYKEAFKNILSEVVDKDIKVRILMGSGQSKREFTQIECSLPKKIYKSKSFNCFSELCNDKNIINMIWPKVLSDKKIFENFYKIILDKKNLVNDYSFGDSFIRDLCSEKLYRYKQKTIETIFKRLNITTAEANVDPQIQEESIGDIKRIRVTPRPSSVRIHFKIMDSIIIFQNYYSSGEHDDGL